MLPVQWTINNGILPEGTRCWNEKWGIGKVHVLKKRGKNYVGNGNPNFELLYMHSKETRFNNSGPGDKIEKGLA